MPGDEKLVSPWRRENVPGWDASTIEWLFLFAVAVVVWYVLLPVGAMLVTLVSLHLLGDSLRDVLDPANRSSDTVDESASTERT